MMRTAGAFALAAALLVAGCTAGQGRIAGDPAHGRPRLNLTANPAALIATEIAFNRRAQEKGTWSAFREYADKDAVMFVPEKVSAQEWLNDRAEPAIRLTWQPHRVWVSCDGSLGATKGAWQRSDGTVGYFTTIWQRQDDGSYKWDLDQGDTLKAPLVEPEMIDATVADCSKGATGFAGLAVPLDTAKGGMAHSMDGTLAYTYALNASNDRVISVSIWRNGEMQEVMKSEVSGTP